jgi:hypothetical protein
LTITVHQGTCIAFASDNSDVMSGGLWHDAAEKNVFEKLIYVAYNKAQTGVVYLAYILNNCVHQAMENLEIDNECVNCKITSTSTLTLYKPNK